MQRSLSILFAIAAVSFGSNAVGAHAQAVDSVQSQPAPIVRANPGSNSAPANGYDAGYANSAGYANPNAARPMPQITNSQPIPGVLLRVEPGTVVQTVSADAKGTQLRIDHGRANVSVHHPAPNSELLVDLPGGQTTLLKDGLYTFNADTNTVTVLKGEAQVYPGPSAKPIKIKEDHQLTFAANGTRSVEADRGQLTADLLPYGEGAPRAGYGSGYRGYGYGPYGDGYYGYPYVGYGYGYPGWGYGYPYGYGIGLGFGYYGGFRGGYRGGYGYRGFRR